MAIFAVISDIHGNANNLRQAFNVAEQYKADFYLILGDLLNHGPRNGVPEGYDPLKIAELMNKFKEKIIAVRGNCDSEVDSMLIDVPINSTSNVLIVNNHKCFMTHGHKYKEEDANKLGLGKNDYFLSGHTHLAKLKRDASGVIIFNPGSITFPKESLDKTMGIITESMVKLVKLSGELICEMPIN